MTIKFYDAHHKDDKKYWDISCLKKLLSHQADVYGAQSPRNYGKSYSGMQLCNEAIMKGENCFWGRYNKPESGQAYNTWLEFAPNLTPLKVPDSPFKWLIDECTGGKLCIFYWSVSQNAKGIDTPSKYMVCDEFIPERYTAKTRLDTEFADWDSVRKSIVRSYGTIPILFSNNIFWNNPFFLQWGIPPFSKGQIIKKIDTFSAVLNNEKYSQTRTVVFENVAGTKEIINRNLKEQALSFSSSRDLQRYFDNETKQEYTRIAKCPDLKKALEPIQLMSDGYYIGVRKYSGELYFCHTSPSYEYDTYVSEPEYIDIRRRHFRPKSVIPSFEDYFNSGICVFDTPDTLMAFMRWLRHSRQRIS